MEQVAHELIYRPSAADIERVNRIRREFAPDVDYACELSMARYFGLLDDQLRWLYEHPDEARRMGQAGREAVARYFHAERMAQDVRAVFEEAVAARRQQRTRAPRRLTSDAAV